MKRLSWRALKVGHCRQIEKLSCRTAPWRGCNFPALVALITHPDQGHVLFDTGYAPAFFEKTNPFPERIFRLITPVELPPHEYLSAQLTARGIALGDIRTVILSHFHPDHMAGVADIPSAAIVCAREGFDIIRNATRFGGLRRGMITTLLPSAAAKRTRFFEDLPVIAAGPGLAPFDRAYDIFGDGSLAAIPLPGHAPGQYGLRFVGEDGRTVFLVADAAWSTQAVRDNTLPMALAARLVHHTSAYPQTLLALHHLITRNSNLLMVPSHCRERQHELTGCADA